MLHKALEGVIMMETFPKTTVDVFALVLESGGSKSHDSLYSYSLNDTKLLSKIYYQNMVTLWEHRCLLILLDIGARGVDYGIF